MGYKLYIHLYKFKVYQYKVKQNIEVEETFHKKKHLLLHFP